MGELVVDVEREDGEPVGVTVDDTLAVVKVTPGSIASEANLKLGDTIASVNGISVANKEQFFQKLKYAHPRLRLGYKRIGGAEEGAKAEAKEPAKPTDSDQLPPEQEKLLRRRPGFSYMTVDVDWPANQDKPLGIILATRLHRVIVGSLKRGSLGEEKLKVLDRVVAINGAPVSDKDVAKTLIVASGGKFQALVERPLTEEAKAEHSRSTAPDVPSVPAAGQAAPEKKAEEVGGDPSILPHDCLAITKTEREIRTSSPKTPLPGILRLPNTLRTSSKISHHDDVKTHDIQRDTPESKRLRRTPLLFGGK